MPIRKPRGELWGSARIQSRGRQKEEAGVSANQGRTSSVKLKSKMGGRHENQSSYRHFGRKRRRGRVMGARLHAGSAAASKGTIVAFIISSTNPYIGQWKKGAEAKAKELGYDIKVIENNFNQTKRTARSNRNWRPAKKPPATSGGRCRTRLALIRFAPSPRLARPSSLPTNIRSKEVILIGRPTPAPATF